MTTRLAHHTAAFVLALVATTATLGGIDSLATQQAASEVATIPVQQVVVQATRLPRS